MKDFAEFAVIDQRYTGGDDAVIAPAEILEFWTDGPAIAIYLRGGMVLLLAPFDGVNDDAKMAVILEGLVRSILNPEDAERVIEIGHLAGRYLTPSSVTCLELRGGVLHLGIHHSGTTVVPGIGFNEFKKIIEVLCGGRISAQVRRTEEASRSVRQLQARLDAIESGRIVSDVSNGQRRSDPWRQLRSRMNSARRNQIHRGTRG